MRSRKGSMLMNPIVIAIVVIVIMTFLLLFVKKNDEAGDIAAREASCRASIAAHAKFGTAVNCPMEQIRIKTKDGDEALKQVADSLVRCWDNYGAGKLAIFPKGGTKYCAVCSTITFKKKDMFLPALPLYLATHYFKRDGLQINYDEYLMGGSITPDDVEYYKTTAITQSMDTSKDYVVLFTFEKKRDFWDNFASYYIDVMGTINPTYKLLADAGTFGEQFKNRSLVTTWIDNENFILSSYNDRRLQQVGGDTWLPTVSITYLNSASLNKLKCEELPVSLTGLEAIPDSETSGAE